MKATYVAFIIAIVAVAVGSLWYTQGRSATGITSARAEKGSYVFTCDRGVEFVLTPSSDMRQATVTPVPGAATIREETLYESATDTGRRYRGEEIELHGLGEGASLYIISSGVTHTCRQQPKPSEAPLNFGEEPLSQNAGAQTETIVARMGEEVSVLGETLRIERIAEDSRCPADVQCIWAGTVRVDAIMGTGMGDSQLRLTLGEVATTEINAYELVSVEPAPREGTQIEPSDYSFTVRAARR